MIHDILDDGVYTERILEPRKLRRRAAVVARVRITHIQDYFRGRGSRGSPSNRDSQSSNSQ
jgi:hypothetical protein